MVMLVTCRELFDIDSFQISVTFFMVLVILRVNQLPTSETCHQHISSPTTKYPIMKPLRGTNKYNKLPLSTPLSVPFLWYNERGLS